MANAVELPYAANAAGALPHGRPSYGLRGWDDGSVYVDIRCACGRHLYDDERPLSTPEKGGRWRLVCPVCRRRYTVQVLAVMRAPDEP